MRITDIRQLRVPLEGNLSNAVVSFADHDISLVAVVSDVVRAGRPVVGIGFNSIGRYAQPGLLEERFIRRVIGADPTSLLSNDGRHFSPTAVVRELMTNEKPGGHGDRAGAVAAIELAIWDLNAKLDDVPAYQLIAATRGVTPMTGGAQVYAAGGYYTPGGTDRDLQDELKSYADLGYTAFKIKIGGAPLTDDLRRIEAALVTVGDSASLAVDANARFDLKTALAYADALSPYRLRWYEEPGDPLDFDLNRQVAEHYPGTIATGENLFSRVDSRNLVRYGGMRPGLDVFQMDAGLSYGLTEYFGIIDELEAAGHSRKQACPHGGQLLNLHIVYGLGLGGCEAYPGIFRPFGGYADECVLENGRIRPSDAPGFGLEQKRELAPLIAQLTI
jgi:L-alanine-DL-glutamate epimerase-like enolase superfamily enzyme